MQIYQATQKGPLKISGFVDPDDTTNITVFWGAPAFLANTVYRAGDVVSPSVDNGYYYQCTVNGKSHSAEPTWTQEETVSGSVTFLAVPWDLWLLPNEYITNSTWSSTNLVPMAGTNFANTFSNVIINPFSNTVSQFELTNQITKSSGETLSRSFLYKSNQQ